jgi:methyl-accepting chemotaxis protein
VLFAFGLCSGIHMMAVMMHINQLDTAIVLGGLGLQYTYHAYTAWCTEQSEAERFEIDFLIRAMGSDGPIRLNLDVLRADTSVGQRLKHVQQRTASAIRQVHSLIEGVQSASDVLRQGSDELKGRTDSTAAGLRDAAMCLEQINVIVQTSAQASVEARTMAAHATELANNGGHQVRQVVSTMQAISQSSSKITDIISVIDGIAFQTNILALNAAVEAARAGEQGRGFAVVAAEVRSLALRSSEAAREIKSLIGASMQTIEAGVKQVNLTGSTMEDIVVAVRRVGEVFEQLSADSHEHAGGIDVVTQSVKELDQVTQQNIAVAERASGVATELTDHAEQMTEVLSAFKLGGIVPVESLAVTRAAVAPRAPRVAVAAAAPTPLITHLATPPVSRTPAPASSAAAPKEAAGIEFF